MVLLTMTPSMVDLIHDYSMFASSLTSLSSSTNEPSLVKPTVGNPISHGQLMEIAIAVREQRQTDDGVKSRGLGLENLLRGSRVYIAPPKPKPEPVYEFRIYSLPFTSS